MAAAAADAEYEDRVFRQQPLGPTLDDAAARANIATRKAAVEKAITAGDGARAVEAALADPPYGASAELKMSNLEVVGRAFGAVKEKDIEAVVSKLSATQGDVCMKYVYRLMEVGDAALLGSLLKWHALLTEKFGLGSIIRTMTDQPSL